MAKFANFNHKVRVRIEAYSMSITTEVSESVAFRLVTRFVNYGIEPQGFCRLCHGRLWHPTMENEGAHILIKHNPNCKQEWVAISCKE